jgi:hypothetical protein
VDWQAACSPVRQSGIASNVWTGCWATVTWENKVLDYNFVYRMLSIVARRTFPKTGFVKIRFHKVRHVIA